MIIFVLISVKTLKFCTWQ